MIPFRDDSIKAVLVAEGKDELLSTASLQISPDKHGAKRLRWIGTERDWRREGLARALVITLVEVANKTGCQETYIHTTTDPLGAITLYLQLGFKPPRRHGH